MKRKNAKKTQVKTNQVIDIPKQPSQNNPDQLLRKMATMPNVPSAIRKTITPAFTTRFMEIMTSPKAIETDWMYLCGYLTSEQAEQYQMASGDHDACAHELMILAVAIADYFRPRLIDIMKNDSKGRSSEGMNDLFKKIIKLVDVRCDSLRHLPTTNWHLMKEFTYRVMALIGSDVVDIRNDDDIDDAIKKVAEGCLESGENFFRTSFGTQFIGIQFHNEKKVYEMTMNINGLILDLAIGTLFGGRFETKKQELVCENNSLFAFIKKESIYKTVPLVTLRKNFPQIIAIGSDTESGHRLSSLCAIRINFTMKTIGFPELKQDLRGCAYFNYGIHLGIINLTVNAHTGDLCFITGGIPFSRIVSEDRYIALQNFVFRKLKGYLDSKEPDIKDLFLYFPNEVAMQKEEAKALEIVEEITEYPCINETDTDEIAEIQKQDQWEYVAFQKDDVPIKSFAKEVNPFVFVLPKHLRTVIMDRIYGASAEETLAALRRMLGKEEKTEGSHLFFRSDRNGLLLPVPKHSRKDKHHIAFGLILNNLKLWEYSPMEFAEELGVHIPERICVCVREELPSK